MKWRPTRTCFTLSIDWIEEQQNLCKTTHPVVLPPPRCRLQIERVPRNDSLVGGVVNSALTNCWSDAFKWRLRMRWLQNQKRRIYRIGLRTEWDSFWEGWVGGNEHKRPMTMMMDFDWDPPLVLNELISRERRTLERELKSLWKFTPHHFGGQETESVSPNCSRWELDSWFNGTVLVFTFSFSGE